MSEEFLTNEEVAEKNKSLENNIPMLNKMTIIDKLAIIQQELKAPKGQFNTYSNFYYRSCEDILEALKPLLGDCVVKLSDELVMLGNRFYIKATATLTDGVGSEQSTGYARESDSKKGMDDSQLTGATSSYARKYALNGLFLIDDTKDADTNSYNDSNGNSNSNNQGQQNTNNNSNIEAIRKIAARGDANEVTRNNDFIWFHWKELDNDTKTKLSDLKKSVQPQ